MLALIASHSVLSIHHSVDVSSDILPHEVMHVREESLESGTTAGQLNDEEQSRGKLTAEIVDRLLREEHYTPTRIATEWGVSKQYVNQLRNSVETPYRSPRKAVMENFPWPKMESKFKEAPPCRRAKDHMEYVATGGEGMQDYKLKRLFSWYRMLKMDDVVLKFDPTIPPKHDNKAGGWEYVKREGADGNLIIRVNEHTKLTDEGREIWVFPPGVVTEVDA